MRRVVYPCPTFLLSKYVVLTQINENLGQGGRCANPYKLVAYMSVTKNRVDILCHWQEGDCVAQEMFTNVSVLDPLCGPGVSHPFCSGLCNLYMHSSSHILIVSRTPATDVHRLCLSEIYHTFCIANCSLDHSSSMYHLMCHVYDLGAGAGGLLPFFALLLEIRNSSRSDTIIYNPRTRATVRSFLLKTQSRHGEGSHTFGFFG